MKKSREPKSPVDAVQLVYAALEPFDDQARRRIVESAASLLGMRVGQIGTEPVRGPQVPVTPGTTLQPNCRCGNGPSALTSRIDSGKGADDECPEDRSVCVLSRKGGGPVAILSK